MHPIVWIHPASANVASQTLRFRRIWRVDRTSPTAQNPDMTPTSAQLRKAAKIREKIEKLEAEIAAILGGQSVTKRTAQSKKRARRKLSAEARARISAAQKKRWAKQKKQTR